MEKLKEMTDQTTEESSEGTTQREGKRRNKVDSIRDHRSFIPILITTLLESSIFY